jgi:fructoselysine-6-P-deglycase FrlB-like protein
MNTFLQDILEQPAVLDQVLAAFVGEGPTVRADIREAAERIAGSSRVVLSSMGSAYYSCMPMAYALSRVHPNVQLIETAELMRLPQSPGTLYVILSRSGESGEVAAFAKVLRERGESLVAVTMTPDSTLARNATLVVHDPSPYDGLICTKAYTTLALAGLLVVSSMQGTIDDALVSALRRAFAWMEQEKGALLERIRDYACLGRSLTFLARGSGLGLAAAGSLWMEEGARVRASWASIDGFMHGPIEQVDQDFLGVWIDLLPDATSARQYRDVATRGGSLVPLSLPDAYAEGIVVPVADLPEAYRVIPAALPIQMLAQQAAANRGLVAGQMRYVGWLIR